MLTWLIVFLLAVFIAPALASAGWWYFQDRPASWHSADWTATGLLPPAASDRRAAIYVLTARTGGLKGAFAVHTWIVLKKPGARSYERFDKVGWGTPVRRNAYPADGRWYSNLPSIVREVHGAEAQRLLPRVEAAIESYPFSGPGDYRIWPGPNSNSFVAHVLKSVPELGARMPPNAVGRDFTGKLFSFSWLGAQRELRCDLGGLVGFAAGAGAMELHFLGLVAGFDFARPALLVPGYGRVELASVG